jgi:hypothetical protein
MGNPPGIRSRNGGPLADRSGRRCINRFQQTVAESYRDFTFPDKFSGVLPVLYDDDQGNVIYQVPRRYPSLARVVDRARFEALQPLEQTNLDLLRAYTR